MVYRFGFIDTVAGRLALQGSGLALGGEPMMMREATALITAALGDKLVKLCPALWGTRPSYVLTVRGLLVLAIPGAEYVYDVVPMGQQSPQKLHSPVKTIVPNAIRLPQGFP